MDWYDLRRRFDWMFFACLVGVVLVGLVFISSARPVRYPKLQFLWIVIGFAVFFALLRVHYLTIADYAYVMYGLGLAGLVFVLIPGNPLAHRINNAHRWITLGPIRLQPSEFMKVAVVLALAKYLMYRKNYRTLRGLIGPFVLILLPVVLILREPDLGTAMVFMPIFFMLLFAAGAKLWHLLTIIALGVLSCPLLYLFVMSVRQRMRIIAFLDPAKYSAGAAYQLIQSMIAIGAGGLWGARWRRGTQNLLQRVPEPHTDFIFAVIGEESGFIGCVVVLILYLLLLLCAIGVARRTREPCGRLLALGVVTVFLVQISVNIGMTMGLAPITGMTLPFISYGGSSLLASFVCASLVMNVAIRQTMVLAREDFDYSEKDHDLEYRASVALMREAYRRGRRPRPESPPPENAFGAGTSEIEKTQGKNTTDTP